MLRTLEKKSLLFLGLVEFFVFNDSAIKMKCYPCQIDTLHIIRMYILIENFVAYRFTFKNHTNIVSRRG